MALTIRDPGATPQRELPEKTRGPAKVAPESLRKPDNSRRLIGHAINRARLLQGWSLKEFAAALGRDERQIARWIDGSERPQFDVMFTVAGFAQVLVVAFAEIAGKGVRVTTHIDVDHEEAG